MNNYNPNANKPLHWNVTKNEPKRTSIRKKLTKLFLYSSWTYLITLLIIELLTK